MLNHKGERDLVVLILRNQLNIMNTLHRCGAANYANDIRELDHKLELLTGEKANAESSDT